jgi:hypothetical protein
VVVGVVVLIVMTVVVLRFRHSNNNKVVAALEEFNHDYEELKEKLELTCRALSLSFSTVDDGWDLRSASRPNSVSSQRSSASTINPHQSSASVNWFLGMLRLLQKASCHYCVCQCVDESQVYGELSRGLDVHHEEMEKSGTDEDKVCYKYVRHQEAVSFKKG